ncbi:MAG: hypothetical protein PHE20_01465 [Patescibacteria group bacterium]|nr:hypothetical protein [Patescibacteria group bacterium]
MRLFRNVKLSWLFVIILLILVIVLFLQKQGYKYELIYKYRTIPDIDLSNTLQEFQDSNIGEIRGFVKFDNVSNQPKNLKQYYIIKPLNKFDENLLQYYSVEEIIKMDYLPPASIGFSEIKEVSKTYNIVTLEDENGNQFFINRNTKEVSMRDSSGDNTILITDEWDYSDFMTEWLK